ncbi:hypothetical protein PAJ34TS1_32210 [Paenibacillus azoreducens]
MKQLIFRTYRIGVFEFAERVWLKNTCVDANTPLWKRTVKYATAKAAITLISCLYSTNKKGRTCCERGREVT